MRYLDQCQYDEDYSSGVHTYTFHGPCIKCKARQNVTVQDHQLYQYNQGAKIQEAFPDLKPDEREFLMSGICGPCFNAMFPDE